MTGNLINVVYVKHVSFTIFLISTYIILSENIQTESYYWYVNSKYFKQKYTLDEGGRDHVFAIKI